MSHVIMNRHEKSKKYKLLMQLDLRSKQNEVTGEHNFLRDLGIIILFVIMSNS